jgi:MFS family permease
MKNIRLAYVLTFLSECYFPFTPFLFFYLRYFSFEQIAILTAIQMAAGNIFEMPTGAFADLVGRRTSIVLSFVIGAAALAVFSFVTAFWIFAILEVVKGLANALYSGSLEALVYDTLKEKGAEKQYGNVAANMETAAWVGYLVAAIGAGYLYTWYFRGPWLLQAGMYVVAAILAFRLVEPQLDRVKVNIGKALKQNLVGFHELFSSGRVTRITLQLAIVGAGYIIASNILGVSQAREYGMDARGVGWLFAGGYVFSILASRFFPKLKGWVGEKKLIVFTSTMLLASFFGAKYVGLFGGSALIIMRIASSSTFRNTRSVIVNEWISSRNRATALSTLNLLTQTPYIFLSPLFGAMIDHSSPNNFALMLGVGIIGILGGLQLLDNHKV